jgi:hypothetical protein
VKKRHFMPMTRLDRRFCVAPMMESAVLPGKTNKII